MPAGSFATRYAQRPRRVVLRYVSRSAVPFVATLPGGWSRSGRSRTSPPQSRARGSVRAGAERRGDRPAGGQPDAEDVARILVGVEPACDARGETRRGRERRLLREVPVAVRIDLVDVVVRLVRIADRRRVARARPRRSASRSRRRCRVPARRCPSPSGASTSATWPAVELRTRRPDPGCRARRPCGDEKLVPDDGVPVLAERARDDDVVAGRGEVDEGRLAREARRRRPCGRSRRPSSRAGTPPGSRAGCRGRRRCRRRRRRASRSRLPR